MKQRRNRHTTISQQARRNSHNSVTGFTAKNTLLKRIQSYVEWETHQGKNDKATTLHRLRGIDSVLVICGDHEVLRGASCHITFGQRKQSSVWASQT